MVCNQKQNFGEQPMPYSVTGGWRCSEDTVEEKGEAGDMFSGLTF